MDKVSYISVIRSHGVGERRRADLLSPSNIEIGGSAAPPIIQLIYSWHDHYTEIRAYHQKIYIGTDLCSGRQKSYLPEASAVGRK